MFPAPVALAGDTTVQVVPSVHVRTFALWPPKTTVALARFEPVSLTTVPPLVAPVVPAQVPAKFEEFWTTHRLEMVGEVVPVT